jgi:hypothetical protein
VSSDRDQENAVRVGPRDRARQQVGIRHFRCCPRQVSPSRAAETGRSGRNSGRRSGPVPAPDPADRLPGIASPARVTLQVFRIVRRASRPDGAEPHPGARQILDLLLVSAAAGARPRRWGSGSPAAGGSADRLRTSRCLLPEERTRSEAYRAPSQGQ